MSLKVHAQVDEKHFEIVGPTFSNTAREFRRPLYRIGCKCKPISTDFENCLYSRESCSGCRNQASLRWNTPLRKHSRPQSYAAFLNYVSCSSGNAQKLIFF